MSSKKSMRKAKVEIADSDRCVYCGKRLHTTTYDYTALAHSRRFPVCSPACQAATERYVQMDKKYKSRFYLLLFGCSITILITSIFGQQSTPMYLAVFSAGFGFAMMPYPISSFETFISTPIRTVTTLCRILGIALCILACVFYCFA